MWLCWTRTTVSERKVLPSLFNHFTYFLSLTCVGWDTHEINDRCRKRPSLLHPAVWGQPSCTGDDLEPDEVRCKVQCRRVDLPPQRRQDTGLIALDTSKGSAWSPEGDKVGWSEMNAICWEYFVNARGNAQTTGLRCKRICIPSRLDSRRLSRW